MLAIALKTVLLRTRLGMNEPEATSEEDANDEC